MSKSKQIQSLTEQYIADIKALGEDIRVLAAVISDECCLSYAETDFKAQPILIALLTRAFNIKNFKSFTTALERLHETSGEHFDFMCQVLANNILESIYEKILNEERAEMEKETMQ